VLTLVFLEFAADPLQPLCPDFAQARSRLKSGPWKSCELETAYVKW